jgi:hypothetical protein
MAKYYPSQVNFTSAEERKEFQDFCKEYFGRPFSTQVRRMLQQAKREAQQSKEPHGLHA